MGMVLVFGWGSALALPDASLFVVGGALQIAEKLDFVLAFGWRSALALRFGACYLLGLQPLR